MDKVKNYCTKIRQATINDLNAMHKLYVRTIDACCSKDYNAEQREAWKSGIKNKSRWIETIENQYFLVAEIENYLAGFGSLKNGEYIDFLYVDQNYLRKAVASQIYNALELAAKRLNKNTLSSNVSITARPFFEGQGFTILRKNTNVIIGIEIINYHMTKSLS